ncbi:MAG: sensor histidine kinase [Cellvibrionaceae bacterium]
MPHPHSTQQPPPSNGTIKMTRDGHILWADEDAIALLDLSHPHGNISDSLNLDGGKPLSEHLSITLEAAAYSTRGSSAICRAPHAPETSLHLSLWMDDDNTDNLICLLAVTQPRNTDSSPETQDLLSALAEIQKDYIADKGSFYVFGRALDSLLQLTHSEYGFIGEILPNAEGSHFLKTHAITNIAWNEETRSFYQQNAPSGMEFHNHETLFGYTVKHGKQLISNNPSEDKHAGGLPPGHPDLNTYLGLPIYCGEEFIGMAGIANREGGYSEELAHSLAPLTNTLGTLLSAYRNEEKRKHAEAQLRTKAHQLEQANQAKTNFFATMSHELRTPLNSILGFSTRLHKSLQEHLNDRDEQAFDAVIRNAKHLTALINDILDVSKMEAGKMEIMREPLRLYDVVSEAITAISGMADNRKVEIVDKVNAELKHLKVLGDEKRLLQVALNLLSNAIKYGEGSAVEIGLTRQNDDHLILMVEDFGPGISEAIQQTLFQLYASSASTPKDHMQSTGLGLALVAEITKLHEGRIWVDTQPGRGSRFYVALPLLK